MSEPALKELLLQSVRQGKELADVLERFERSVSVEFSDLHRSIDTLASKTRAIEVTASATRRELNQALARLKAFEKEVAALLVDANDGKIPA